MFACVHNFTCDVHFPGGLYLDLHRHRQKIIMMSHLSWSLSSTSSPTRRMTRGVPWMTTCYPTCFCHRIVWSCWRRQREKCWRKRGGTSKRNSGTGILTTSGFASRRGKAERGGWKDEHTWGLVFYYGCKVNWYRILFCSLIVFHLHCFVSFINMCKL